MHTVTFLETSTVVPYWQQSVGTIEFAGSGAPVIEPTVAREAAFLFRDVDQADPVAVVAAMRDAPRHFDGGYLRATYTET